MKLNVSGISSMRGNFPCHCMAYVRCYICLDVSPERVLDAMPNVGQPTSALEATSVGKFKVHFSYLQIGGHAQAAKKARTLGRVLDNRREELGDLGGVNRAGGDG